MIECGRFGRAPERNRAAGYLGTGRTPLLEIEAKFRVPDEQTLLHLLGTSALAGYTLGPVVEAELRDCYLDTPEGAFLAAGYAFRLRHEADQTIVALKGLGHAEGAVHRRAEHEMTLPATLRPEEWPAGPVRDMVLRLRGDQPVEVLFEICQIRRTRQILDGERLVGGLFGDKVSVYDGRAAKTWDAESVTERALGVEASSSESPAQKGDPIDGDYMELEVELLPSGTDEDLARIVRELHTNWNLDSVSESKFQRALAMVHDDRLAKDIEPGSAPRLTAEERKCLLQLAEGRAVLARRARLVLAWDEGAPLAEMLTASELSPRQARFWRRAFRKSRLGIFPEYALLSAARGEEPNADRAQSVGVSTEPGGYAEPAPPSPEIAPAAGRPNRPSFSADDLMSEAGRRVLGYHFQRMLLNEPGTREGVDIEALHDMRVATRRMRAAFRIFGGHFERDTIAPHVKALQRTGRALGEVRDLDVFEQKTQAYVESLPEALTGGLDAFMIELHAQRDAARRKLLAHLDSARYERFVARFTKFIDSPEESLSASRQRAEPPKPCLVRHVAPLAIMERLAAVRAFEGWVDAPDAPLERYHALRIATKRLRYALESFSEVMGPESQTLIKKTVALQDHLGRLQDGVVASGILRDFLVWGTWGSALDTRPHGRAPTLIAPGVALYLAERQSEVQKLVAGFPAVWSTITAPEFVRRLTAALGTLSA